MKNRDKVFKIEYVLYGCVLVLVKFFHFVYPSGKPMSPHLLRCQGLAVDDYSFALGRLEAGATSTFAQLGIKIHPHLRPAL